MMRAHSGKMMILRRMQALMCLFCLLAGPTAVLPQLLAVASMIEGSHTTYAGIANGEFKLRLSHERGQPGRIDFLARHQPTNPLHHHGLASKILCTLAGNNGPRLADHIANFSLGSASERARREVRSAPPSSSQSTDQFSAAAVVRSCLSPLVISVPSEKTYLTRTQESDPSNGLPGVSTVVLLI